MDKVLKLNFLLLGILILGLSACGRGVKESPCTEYLQTLELEGADTNWFSRIRDNRLGTKYFDIKSSNGLTDVMSYDSYEGYFSNDILSDFLKKDLPCHLYDFEFRLIDYSSSLYEFYFDIKIIQTNEGLYLYIRDYNSSKFDLMYMNYNIVTKEKFNIIYIKGGKKISDYAIEVELISEIEIDSVIYQEVFKITNTMIVEEGKSEDITDYYIDKYFGLIKFKLKSGVYWDVEHESSN